MGLGRFGLKQIFFKITYLLHIDLGQAVKRRNAPV